MDIKYRCTVRWRHYVSSEGTIYFASDKLYALNPNGTQFASPVVLSKAATGPAIDDLNGYVYVAVGNTDEVLM